MLMVYFATDSEHLLKNSLLFNLLVGSCDPTGPKSGSTVAGMESGSGFYAGEGLQIDPNWLIDPKLLFVGPRIGEGGHAKVYEGK